MAKILEVFNRYLYFGGEELVANRIFEQIARTHDIAQCRFDSRSWVGPSAPSRLRQAFLLFYNNTSRDRLAAILREFNPDVLLLHNVYPVGSPAIYHLAYERRIPVLQMVHNYRPFSVDGSLFVAGKPTDDPLLGQGWKEVMAGNWQNSFIKSSVFHLMLTRLRASGWLDSIAAWICISEFVKRKFEIAGVPQSKLHVLRHFWNINNVGVSQTDHVGYLFLGRLVTEKGIQVLLRAWEIMGDDAPLLTIAGEGPLERKVVEFASKHPSIKYVGMQLEDDKKYLLKNCRALIVPSIWWEPLGLTVYESYEYYKPVLAAKSGGLCETVFHYRTGLLYEPNDPKALAQAVKTFEGMSGSQRFEMGQNGHTWLREEASPKIWQRRFDSILSDVLSVSNF